MKMKWNDIIEIWWWYVTLCINEEWKYEILIRNEEAKQW